MTTTVMMRLVQLRRFMLLGSGLLVLLAIALTVGAAIPRDRVQVILPRWTEHIANIGLVLLVLSQLVAAATRRGWRRLKPLVVLTLAASTIVLILGLLSLNSERVEINRVTLPNGRVVMMTLEPGMTDTVFGLWEPHGWRWRFLFDSAADITYSEDHSFTQDPRLVVTTDGRYMLIRRGGIWTDCWVIEGSLKPCLPGEHNSPMRHAEWIGRSARIAALVGTDPSQP